MPIMVCQSRVILKFKLNLHIKSPVINELNHLSFVFKQTFHTQVYSVE